MKKVVLVATGLVAGLALASTTTMSVDASHVVERTSMDSVNYLSQLQPKQVAAAVLVAGGQKNDTWKNLQDAVQNGDGGNLQVGVTTSSKGFTQAGTGSMYLLTIDGNDGGMINAYTISADGSKVYLYTEGMKDSADRTVAPFMTISTKKLVKIAHTSSAVDDIANNVKIDVDN